MGAWARADGHRAVDAVLRDLLGRGVIPRLATQLGRKPVIRVTRPAVAAAEEIDGAELSGRAETLLRRSGRVVVAPPDAAADALLSAYVGAFADRAGDVELRSYLVGLSLIDVVTGEKLWVHAYRVRRLLRHRRAVTPQIQPLAQDRAVDLSGRFADHDATVAARRLSAKLRRSRWLASDAPVRVRLYPLRNRTGERFPSPSSRCRWSAR